MRMVSDITGSILRTIAAEGAKISPAMLGAVQASYLRLAQDYIERYAFDAAINGYPFDRDLEERSAEAFARAFYSAGDRYLTNLLHVPLLPNWNRVVSAFPDAPGWMGDLPYDDNKEFA